MAPPLRSEADNDSKYLTKMLLSCLLLLILLLPNYIVVSQTIISTLPGFPGDLPFKLETGYVGVGELDDVQLFYYFVESGGSPKDDPLVLWLTGGPGCSAFSGLVYEIGPLSFDFTESSKSSPTFKLNPYSWTKVANIIFLDAPVGTGFSYAKSWEGYNMTDTLSAAQTYEFIRKWLMAHPTFQRNPLYIAGDSYSGIVVPIIVEKISDGNEAGRKPAMNLQGYVLGDPTTVPHDDYNSRIPFAHRKTLISDELYESIKTNCNGEYINIDPTNTPCCISKLYTGNILEPTCSYLSPKPLAVGSKWDPSYGEDSVDLLLTAPQIPKPWCRSYNYLFVYIWANNKTVQEALGIREGSIKEWTRCNASLSYTDNVFSTLDYHRNLIKKGYRMLIYSGDQDMVIPYVGTHAWIKSLNLTVSEDWEPWFVDGQVAGYAMEYNYKKCRLRYAIVKGGGHTAPEYKPKECFAMIERWFAYYPL
ncbi:serine carboxypeptidase-like 18 isoform X2 [Corylus avellana]|uniref:serine carboxypeptidase-like 18 isoform X2 n=1 Tax=Corylus avellana TaxID=13451 RepID=UPI00286D5BD0|nr:serine carboxypeptidase-like 18 isoform X2 [Corylus avellana]